MYVGENTDFRKTRDKEGDELLPQSLADVWTATELRVGEAGG